MDAYDIGMSALDWADAAAASDHTIMDAVTVGMSASKKEDASVDIDAVAVADADAEAVSARSDRTFPIQNNHGCSRRLVETQGSFVGTPWAAWHFHKALPKVIPVTQLPMRLKDN